MKRVVLVLTCYLVTAVCSVYGGGIGVFGAYQNTGDADSAAGVGLTAAYPVSLNGHLNAHVRAGYFTGFEIDSGSIPVRSDDVALSTTEVDMTPIEAGVSYKFSLTRKTKIFLSGGVGYYLFGLDGETKQVSGTVLLSTPFGPVPTPWQAVVEYSLNDEIGFYLSAGTEVDITKNFALFMNARYMFLEPTSKFRASGAIGSGSASYGNVRITTQGTSFESSGSDKADLGGLGADLGILWKW